MAKFELGIGSQGFGNNPQMESCLFIYGSENELKQLETTIFKGCWLGVSVSRRAFSSDYQLTCNIYVFKTHSNDDDPQKNVLDLFMAYINSHQDDFDISNEIKLILEYWAYEIKQIKNKESLRSRHTANSSIYLTDGMLLSSIIRRSYKNNNGAYPSVSDLFQFIDPYYKEFIRFSSLPFSDIKDFAEKHFEKQEAERSARKRRP